MKTTILLCAALSLAACGGDKPPVTPPANDTTSVTTTRDPIALAAPTATATPTTTATAAPTSIMEPKATDRSSAQGVVDAFIAAAKAGDKKAMLELFAPDKRDYEATHKKAFTHAIADTPLKVQSIEMSKPMETKGDDAFAWYRCLFKDPSGKDDKESMHFSLKKKDGSWWILAID